MRTCILHNLISKTQERRAHESVTDFFLRHTNHSRANNALSEQLEIKCFPKRSVSEHAQVGVGAVLLAEAHQVDLLAVCLALFTEPRSSK